MARREPAVRPRQLSPLAALITAACFAASPAAVASGSTAHPKREFDASASTGTQFDYCGQASAVFKYRVPVLGVGDTYVEDASDPYRDCSFGLMAASGIGYFRAGIDWGNVEAPDGSYHFEPYDALVADLARHHMTMLGGLLGEPSWESTPPKRGALGGYPPKSPQRFAQFVAACVERYGPNGTFWRENPALPYYPVRAWEIWNEENLSEYWEPHPNMRAYDRLLRASYTAIKRVDRHAIVVTGGMAFYGNADETRFISNLYRYGARGYFDALSIHPYSATVSQAIQRLWTARRLMNRFGDSRKAVWVTEFGWAGGDPDGFVTNPRGQRANAVKFLRFVERNRTRLGLSALFWSAWQDRISAPGPRNWWGFHLGALSLSQRPKPVLGALAAAARVLDR